MRRRVSHGGASTPRQRKAAGPRPRASPSGPSGAGGPFSISNGTSLTPGRPAGEWTRRAKLLRRRVSRRRRAWRRGPSRRPGFAQYNAAPCHFQHAASTAAASTPRQRKAAGPRPRASSGFTYTYKGGDTIHVNPLAYARGCGFGDAGRRLHPAGPPASGLAGLNYCAGGFHTPARQAYCGSAKPRGRDPARRPAARQARADHSQ